MPSTAQTFAFNNSKAAGLPANLNDATDTAGASSTATALTWTSTTAQSRLVTPYTNATATTAPPAVGAAAVNAGWRLRVTPEVDGTAAAPRRVPAGSLTVPVQLTPGAYALLATSPTYTVTLVLYRIDAAGASTELGRGTASGTAAASTLTTFTPAVTLAADVLLAAGETLQAELYVLGAATANTLGAVTNNTVTMTTGPLTASRLVLPAPGLRTRHPRAIADTAPATDTTTRVARFPRAVVDSAPATDALTRKATLGRVLGDTAPATDTTTRVARFPRALADSAPAADSLTRLARFVRATTDTAPAADTVTRRFSAIRNVVDSAPASDAVTRVLIYVRQVLENIGPTGTGTGTGGPAPVTPEEIAAIAAAAANAVWDELTAENRAAGSYGVLVRTNLDGTVSSRATASAVSALAGSVQTVLDRLTAARAAALDLVDVAVSSRTASSVWTAVRAAALDLVDVAVSSRVASTDPRLDQSGGTAQRPTVEVGP